MILNPIPVNAERLFLSNALLWECLFYKALHKAKESPVAEVAAQEEQQQENQKYPLPPSRQGTRTIAGHFDPAVAIQLKRMAAEKETTVQALLTEALNLLFEKHGEKPIA